MKWGWWNKSDEEESDDEKESDEEEEELDDEEESDDEEDLDAKELLRYGVKWYEVTYHIFSKNWKESDEFIRDPHYQNFFTGYTDYHTRYKKVDGLKYDVDKNVWFHIDNRNNYSDTYSDTDSDFED